MSKDFFLFKLLGLVLIIALSNTAQAGKQGYWTWTDEKGNPKYSDRPPEGVDAVFVEKNTTSSPTSSAYDSGSQAADQASNPDKMEVFPAKDPSICEQAKANLSALKSARVRITEADGTQHYLTDEEKKEQRDRAQRLVDMNC